MFYVNTYVMENSVVKSVNNGLTRVWQVCLLSVLFLFSFAGVAVGQSADPSVDNLKNNMSAAAKEMEHQKQVEFMNYVWMCIGFAIVVAVAWSTTVMARKRSKREQEEKQRYILRQQELKKHGHHAHAAHHGHAHGHVKARR